MSPIRGANVTESTMSLIGGRNVTDFWNDCHISVE